MPYKMGFCVLLCALICGLLWWVVTRDKGDQLEQLDKREAELRDDFVEKQGRDSNLEPLKQQLAQMEQQLQQLLRQLPRKNALTDLTVDMSQTELATGIKKIGRAMCRERVGMSVSVTVC